MLVDSLFLLSLSLSLSLSLTLSLSVCLSLSHTHTHIISQSLCLSISPSLYIFCRPCFLSLTISFSPLTFLSVSSYPCCKSVCNYLCLSVSLSLYLSHSTHEATHSFTRALLISLCLCFFPLIPLRLLQPTLFFSQISLFLSMTIHFSSYLKSCILFAYFFTDLQSPRPKKIYSYDLLHKVPLYFLLLSSSSRCLTPDSRCSFGTVRTIQCRRDSMFEIILL